MGHAGDIDLNVSKESVLRDLVKTLSHLYDPVILRRSALLPLLGLDRRSNPIAALQNALIGAIEALKPPQNVPTATGAWQTYLVLRYRYVEQRLQHHVARELGLSTRQLRRREKAAVQTLVDYLWTQYKLDEKSGSTTPSIQRAHDRSAANLSASPEMLNERHELEWLQKSVVCEPIDLSALIDGIVTTIRPLSHSTGVLLLCSIPDNCPRINAHLTTLRQAILCIIVTAVHLVSQGRVEIGARTTIGGDSVELQITAHRGSAPPMDIDPREDLEFARKLLQMSRGVLEAVVNPGANIPFAARLVLPAVPLARILVIDDNPDMLGLVQRYLFGTRYEFHGTTDPDAALVMAEEIDPEIILLDVMLPNIDGWELLGRLREHPKLGRASIIICTILPQEELALTLGAGDFIRKPVRRKDLLTVLDRHISQVGRDVLPTS